MAFRPQRFSIASSKSSVSWNHIDGSLESFGSLASSYATSASTASISWGLQGPSLQASCNSSITAQQKFRSTKPPAPVFQRLPLEVYDCILQSIAVFHDEQSSMSCQTCYLRDLCALALTDRAWDRAVRERLYRKIHIVGHDSPAQAKKFKMKNGVRLKLLRRTLRERRVLAQHVRELKVPRVQPDEDVIDSYTINLVASVVMSCPNLERLVGFYPIYSHNYNRLTHALSTRPKLKEHVWIIGDNADITERSHKQLPPGLMDAEQADGFLHFHNAWRSLSTLFLSSNKQGVLEKDIFVQTLCCLPSLKHLCISGFDMDDFDDITLQLLPPLQSLRLQDLAGVTFWGLSEFSRTNSAKGIQRLSLVHLDVSYLSAISNLFLHLTELRRFTLAQESSPEVAPGELVFQPVVASRQLEYLHWDVSVPGSANENLANSIRAGGFPNLQTIRAPSDHGGLLQMVCKPRAQIVLPSDKYSKAYHDAKQGGFDSLAWTLLTARKAAQQRIDEARNTIGHKIVVEEEGFVREVFDIQGYVGSVKSNITYSLDADMPGSDDALVDFPDLVSGAKETATKDGCSGLWNASHPVGKKWWHHIQRHRYRPTDLQRFF